MSLGTLQRRSQTASRNAGIDFKALAECSSDIIMQIGPDGSLLYVSPSVTSVLGWTQQEMYEWHKDVIFEGDRDALFEKGSMLISGKLTQDRAAFRMYDRGGNLIWVEGAAHRLISDDGKANGFAFAVRDISTQKQLEKQLTDLARTDGLTGLANRRAFDEMLEREWKIARRERTEISLLIADLDLFKGLNDSYGHHAGDQCLQAIAQTIRSTVRRPADVAARYGGEEMAILLPRTPEAGARTIAGYIHRAVEDLRIPHERNSAHGGIATISIGVATAHCLEGCSFVPSEALLAEADRNLYKAKNSGRNRVECSILTVDGGMPLSQLET